MLSAIIVYGSTFLTVFALGLQSLNVNQGHYAAAAVTSVAISSGHLWLYKVMPNPTWLDLAGYYLGGVTAILASMWFHRVAKAWWKARGDRRLGPPLPRPAPKSRDEHADVGRCGLLVRDDIH